MILDFIRFPLYRYRYGGTVVPFEDVQEYDNGGKGFRLIGFTKEATMQDKYFAGTGIWLVVPQSDRVAAKQMAGLVQALRNLQLAMIVRYTYNSVSTPKVMCLYPNSIDAKHNSFCMYELFYKDNFVDISFPRLRSKRTELSDEQYAAVDKLIDAMDLMGESTENDMDDGVGKKSKEQFKHLMNPSLQHTFRALANRRLNPDEPVIKMDDDLMGLLTPPTSDATKSHIETIKTLFPLETVKVSSKDAFFEKMRKPDDSGYTSISGNSSNGANSENALKTNDISIAIGTINPVKDFAECMASGAPLHRVAEKMEDVITKLIIYSTEMSEPYRLKIHKSFSAYRAAAVEHAHYLYNDWLVKLQKTMNERGKAYLWPSLVADKGYGLITRTESAQSIVTEADAQRFNENKNELVQDRPNQSQDDDGIDMEYNQQIEDAMKDLF